MELVEISFDFVIFSMFENIKATYMPMIWFKETATLTNKFLSMTNMLLTLSTLGVYVGWSLFGIGLILIFLGTYFLLTRNKEDDDTEQLLVQGESDRS